MVYNLTLNYFLSGGFSDSDEEDSVRSTTTATKSRRSVIRLDDSDDDLDDISPYDSISNAGGLKVDLSYQNWLLPPFRIAKPTSRVVVI